MGQHGVLCEVLKICRVIRTKLNQLVQENVRIITILLKRWCHRNKHFAELASHQGEKNSWHRYAMKKLRHCHPVYSIYRTVSRAVYNHGHYISAAHGSISLRTRAAFAAAAEFTLCPTSVTTHDWIGIILEANVIKMDSPESFQHVDRNEENVMSDLIAHLLPHKSLRCTFSLIYTVSQKSSHL